MAPGHPTWGVCYFLLVISFVSFRFVCCIVCPLDHLSRALVFEQHGRAFCNFRSGVLVFLDLKFVLVCRYSRDMDFRIKSCFELSLLAVLYDLFPCVDLDEFTAVLDQFDITSVGPSYMLDLHWNTVTTSYGCLVGQQSMSIYVVRLAWNWYSGFQKLRPQDWAKWARVEAAALCLSGDLMGISPRFVSS